ncbi:hypothetical protein M406DRAFT_264755 [Cryphonectria parasitica EP155]|uniref:Uncharacterized protein n=1 Tax=Cryphonectria parasitica (strain ATCC 38755 / EP155) TaxID=660469 RepID=A0A9P4XXZ1_CRYP1|nr:uncharacterized protein M406DRAFT_264755 [Cryphonectria parasitica EP155]KAF3762968.1 hypothetical protein M406DRAFT_264755 [Cryphonectria parasitica EP155]
MLNRILNSCIAKKSFSASSGLLQSHLHHFERFLYIEFIGYEIMLCSFCLEEGVRCKMVDGVKSCSQCIKRSCSCDAGWIPVSSCKFSNCFLSLHTFPDSTFLVFCITNELIRLDSREVEEEERLLERQRELADA